MLPDGASVRILDGLAYNPLLIFMVTRHWYYEDFIREQNPAKFPSYTLKTFCEILFRTCPPLQHLANDHDRAFDQFMQYKTRVPVCGAIMLNETWDKVRISDVVLVCGL